MRQRRLLRFHGLKRGRVRQTWNKYNLYNLFRSREPLFRYRTFFQQKWTAKSITRAYHGEHIKEYQWERMFNRRTLSAVNMDPKYMARYDGSEQAAGRGSGKQYPPGTDTGLLPKNRGNKEKQTPYMQMMFAPQERRLDIAIFRALFASSARQARQMVLHGGVTVNGKRMRHPSYLLNPGDMFQVDIERVMAATGAPKRGGKGQQKARASSSPAEPAESEEAAEGEAAEGAEDAATSAADADPAALEAAKEKHAETLKQLQARTQAFMRGQRGTMGAKHKQRLRKLIADIKLTMANAKKAEDSSPAKMSAAEEELATLLGQLKLDIKERRKEAEDNQKEKKSVLTTAQRKALQGIIYEERENPFYDPSKPYATPWRPREWMAPFAFIPRYLEVNQNICAAVYLRHPVARPGLTEVPTPFSPVLYELAFNWYLRRG